MPNKVLLILLILFLGCVILFITTNENTGRKSVANVVLVDEVDTIMKFEKTKWQIKKGWGYAYRNEMLEDLMNDPKVRTLNKEGLTDLLGEPDRINDNYLYYTIDQKRAIILPLHTKTLVIKLNENGTVEWMKIHE